MSAETIARTVANKASSEFDDVKEHLKAIRADITSLASSTGKLAFGEAKRQAKYVSGIAGNAADKAAEYRDYTAEKVKEHPLAAIGIAVLAGLAIAAMTRRS